MPKWDPDKCRFVDRPEPDDRPGDYYVSVIDGGRYGLLLGPFQTHRKALDRVASVRQYVSDRYERGWFYAYGTARLELGEANPAGRLNAELGVSCNDCETAEALAV